MLCSDPLGEHELANPSSLLGILSSFSRAVEFLLLSAEPFWV
jgi:hypothetical protein